MSLEYYAFLFLVCPVSLGGAILWGGRHLMTYLMLIEICGICLIFCLVVFGPFEWAHTAIYVIVMSAAEGALGLSIMVNLSRSRGSDRVAVLSLLSVGR